MTAFFLDENLGHGGVRAWPVGSEWSIIGRDAEATGIVVRSPRIGKRHAQVRQHGQGLELILLEGNREQLTRVDGVPVRPHERVLLLHGSLLELEPGVSFRVRGTSPAQKTGGERIEEPRSKEPRSEEPGLGERRVEERSQEERSQEEPPPAPPSFRRSRYLRYLPDPWHQHEGARSTLMESTPSGSEDEEALPFVDRFLLLFEETWEPLEERQDHLPHYFDAATAHPRHVPWLLGWFGLDLGPGWSEEAQRAVLARAGELLERMGTRPGLEELLTLATGRAVKVLDMGGWTIQVNVAGERDPALEGRLRNLVERFKPAHAGWSLAWAEVDLPSSRSS